MIKNQYIIKFQKILQNITTLQSNIKEKKIVSTIDALRTTTNRSSHNRNQHTTLHGTNIWRRRILTSMATKEMKGRTITNNGPRPTKKTK